MDIQIFSDMHCFLQCHVICTAHCILAHRSFKKSVWGLACISGRFWLFTLSDNESPAKSRGSTNYELKNGLGFKVLEVLQLGAVPQNVLPRRCWTNSWQAWHPSWLGLEQCPSQFHYIPRPGNRANKLIGLGAPFRSCLPACGFSEWVISFGARHSSLWKFDINKIVTLHLVKWVLMPFNNTATGAKGCKYGIVGWSLTSKTYSPSTDFEEHIHQYLPSKREVGVWNAPYFKPQQRAKKTQRWNAKEDKHLPESSSKCQVDTWDGS